MRILRNCIQRSAKSRCHENKRGVDDGNVSSCSHLAPLLLSARQTKLLLRTAAIFWRRVYWHADISAAPGPLTRPLDAALEPLVCWTVVAVPVLPTCSQYHTLPPPDT
ncbi:MAG: hypothetical protein R3E01_21590 [Pirellulaceae bacterium]